MRNFISYSFIKAILILSIITVMALNAFASDTTLKSIAPFPFGASVNVTLLRNNPTYRTIAAREYNSLTAENVMKMASIHPGINTYSWDNADTLVNFARQNNQRIHGHTLVWHQSLPGWVTNFAGDSAAWENILKTHIQNVVSHYAGRLASWDVVNEAFNDNGTLRNSIWLQHLGPDYIARCFKYAHEADPSALLFYNDYGHEYSASKLNAIDSLIKSFLQNGVPVHGLGLQMHINKNTSNSSIANAIKVMAQTGLKVHISELDIALNPEGNQSLTFTSALSQLQADKYNFIVRAYKNIPAAQQYGITTWNVSDADTWITINYSRPDWPLLFDSTYQKKQAYYAIIEGLTSNWNYDAAAAQSASGSYTDLGNNGAAITTNFAGDTMTFDDDNSTVQNIGFNFNYNGSSYHQFVLNTNGFIKLGANAPSSVSLFYPTYNANTNGVITAPDVDLLYPYNHDLMGTVTTEYRVYTSGLPGARICTIQYKNVADKLSPEQYSNMNFQVKLHEAGNIIEFVYGLWTASANTSTLITAAAGIKGSYVNNSVNLVKGSGNSWSLPLSTANGIYFINGDYASAGRQFNTRNSVLPDVGRTYRFTTLAITTLPVTLLDFKAVDKRTGIFISWLTANEVSSKDFEIQQSLNGGDFTSISTVMAKGNNSQATNSYSFTDENIASLKGSIYYRLKQNDVDGRSKFSHIITIQRNNEKQMLSITAQNPFTNDFKMQITSGTAGRISLFVINVTGNVLLRKDVQIVAGTTIIAFKETGHLPRGIYLIKGIRDNEASTIKLLKE